jgi:23S rRNA pseudouridine1911/1915/1917 synthase
VLLVSGSLATDIPDLMPVSTEQLTAEADESHSGQRLDRFLSDRFPGLSRTRLQALIREGRVALGPATIEDVKYPVKPGDRFKISVPPPVSAKPQAQAIPLDVVYEDEAIIVIDKPAGLVVHPGAGNFDRTLVNALIAHCGASLSGIGGVARPGIVHRLDKDTSGLLVVAKTDQAHRALSEQFADHGREGDLERGYLALVWGAPPRRHGSIDAPIGRHKTSRTKMAIVPVTRGGREAVTHYQVIATFGHGPEPIASLLECRLETGRTHQVRVHLASIGTPLIGDPVYGQGFKSKLRKLPKPAQEKLAGFDRQALHAARLSFVHPVSGTLLEFNSPLPEDFAMIVEALKEL